MFSLSLKLYFFDMEFVFKKSDRKKKSIEKLYNEKEFIKEYVESKRAITFNDHIIM
ncbi:MAG: hypothetical protein N4A54_00050 [Peptostreptococcaceae bacterium]|nr:hypothetical protein [Peptostreptococcaceae bacterium]